VLPVGGPRDDAILRLVRREEPLDEFGANDLRGYDLLAGQQGYV
jgi:hypothetical protein